MWKLFIADDEPKIRRGLAKALPWRELDIEIVGEAEDGKQALDMIKELQPDIIFVDINMPFMNGLDMIERINESLRQCVVIVISGHDEFSYAQQAVKLKVFDYMLKPVVKNKLEEVVARAIKSLEAIKQDAERDKWVDRQLKNNSVMIRDNFLMKWFDGLLDEEDIWTNLEFFQLPLKSSVSMLAIKMMPSLDTGSSHRLWDRDLLEFATQNVTEDVVRSEVPSFVFRDMKGHIVFVVEGGDEVELEELGAQIRHKLETILEKTAMIELCVVHDYPHGIPASYRRLVSGLKVKGSLSPIVVLAKKFIDREFHRSELSLGDVADGVQVSPTYLSKQLKRELGLSFIDYLTEVRIKKATLLMNDPTIKVYEIAESVGYRSQHYFSNAFKKITGVPPLVYRKGQRS
ncbi:response regulator [Paenibacillus sp. GCM10012307]|uniref:Response regulator n=1 Tax=Paenibacillus roseus TaxID=2798579 RepID=A0A934J6H7_9BACL|nr:response regulator [Paenibacillus roseus]MBJ6362508.1 response regulator [Paenibacillus roseus]